jgi:hypothetical protein
MNDLSSKPLFAFVGSPFFLIGAALNAVTDSNFWPNVPLDEKLVELHREQLYVAFLEFLDQNHTFGESDWGASLHYVETAVLVNSLCINFKENILDIPSFRSWANVEISDTKFTDEGIQFFIDYLKDKITNIFIFA